MKKINIILVFCLVLVISLMFVACNKDKQESESTPEPAPTQHTHTWANVWSKDATNHWYACSGCSEKKDQAAHVYSDDSDATCNVCGYERTIGHTHTWATVWSKDATKHWHECSGCAEKNDEAVHEYTDELDTTCNVCGYERTLAHTHSWASEWSKNDTKHWHACSGCDEKNNEAAHIYDNDHDTTCNTCGYVRSLGDHAAATAWTTTDATHHWKACTHDGCTLKFEYGEHEYDDDHDTICDCGHVREIDPDHYDSGILDFDDTHHWTTCAHDGCTIEFNAANHSGLNAWYTDETNHWHECSICGYIKDQTAHVYDDDHDTTCNTCGYVRSTGDHAAASDWIKNASHHWHECTSLGCEYKYNYEEHQYDNAHDTTCNICGKTREIETGHVASSEWTTNSTYHWHDCVYDGCNLKFDYEEHQYDDDHDTTCNTCGESRVIGTDHAASSEVQFDETYHWNTCAHTGCTFKYNIVEHVYDDDHDTTCNTCGYVRSLGDHATDELQHDATHHWYTCTHDGCTLKFNYEEHTYTNSVCTVCGVGLQFTLNGNEYSVTGYNGNESSITIPSTYNGKSVTSIGANAFSENTSITSITIPASVTSIGNNAFYDCSGLTAVYYTGDIASWCAITFGTSNYTAANPLTEAHNLYINNELQTNIIIPDTVTEIKARAFNGWHGTTITIPNTIVTIGNGAFDSCTHLTRVNYTGNIASWCAINFEGGTANPLYYGNNLYINNELQTNITIPNTVTTINNYAFGQWSGTSVTISSGATTIGKNVFQLCENLSSVTIPTSLTNIGEYAFWYCEALTDIYYSGTTTQWEEINKGSGWNNNTGTYTIHCSNGNIAKS